MKIKISFLILFLIQTLGIFSQTNVMVNEGKQWSVMISSTGIESANKPVTTKISILQGDTIINELTYKKIYSTFHEDLSDLVLDGCIRQNGKQVFYIPLTCNKEIPYFDFNLEIGDTFILNDIIRTVVSTGSIIINNTSLKTITLQHGILEDYWIEGIGSTINGVFSNHFIMAGAKELLLCCHNKKTLLYMNKDYNECYIQKLTDIQKLHSGKTIPNIYYDYVNKKIIIQNKKEQKFRLDLFDISGEKVLISKDISGYEESIDINFLKITSGTYIYHLSNESNQYTNKLQIEK